MSTWTDRYLELLRLTPEPPSLPALARITAAHVQRVPFENVSSILRRQAHGDRPVPPLDREATLDAWRDRRAGGVCFEASSMLDRLLRELGYRTQPVLAQISFPGSHGANLVELDGRRYLADVGNGAPFLEPIALEGEVVVRHAGLAYRFRDGGGGTWLQDRWIDGAWQPLCRYVLSPPDPSVTEAAYQRHHTIGQSWVVDALTLVVCRDDEVWALRGDQLRHYTADGHTVQQLRSDNEYEDVAVRLADLPKLPIRAARAVLASRR